MLIVLDSNGIFVHFWSGWKFDNLCKMGVSVHWEFYLLVDDLQEGVSLLGISLQVDSIPLWNWHNINEVKTLFEFTFSFFYNKVIILLFVTWTKEVQGDIMAYAATYDVMILKNWWGVNMLHLCSPIDNVFNTQPTFLIHLFIHVKFSISSCDVMVMNGICIILAIPYFVVLS